MNRQINERANHLMTKSIDEQTNLSMKESMNKQTSQSTLKPQLKSGNKPQPVFGTRLTAGTMATKSEREELPRPYGVATNNSCILHSPSNPKHEHYRLIKEMYTTIVVCQSSGKRILARQHCLPNPLQGEDYYRVGHSAGDS